jgi:hypothetical protein
MGDSPETFTDPAAARAGLEALLAVTARSGLDLHDPDETENILDLLIEGGHEGLFDVFHDYLHFRLDTSAEGGWVDAHELLEAALSSPDDVLPDIVAAALEDAGRLDPDQRRHALAEVPIVARVRDLLEWIGSGRAVTASGALRRADIGPVAALLGIAARGVAKSPHWGEFRDGAVVVEGDAHVQSMWELPTLAAWWEALRVADLIEITRTRVRRGSAASGWLDEAMPQLDDATAVVAVFVAQELTGALQSDPDDWNTTILRLTLAHAVAALDPDEAVDLAGGHTALDELLRPRAERTLEHLAGAGLVIVDDAGRYRVPDLLRGAFARGVVLAMTFIAGLVDDDQEAFDPGDDDDSSPFDDPEVRATMARLGIVHTPGMAAEVMSELAPLLAEEGIDLDNLVVEDLDVVNAALARATERRNLDRFTPVGQHRAMALTVHRLVAEALAENGVELARAVMAGVQPDPVGNLPSVAQVIGVGLGTLDEWHRDPAVARVVAHARVPEWDAAEVRAARDILKAARNGTAFDQRGALIGRHRGKSVVGGTLLAVAGAAIARAEHEGVTVRDLVGRVLTDD